MKQIFKYLKNRFFTSSEKYWENRYKSGDNSGSGSYNEFAEYKASFINEIISKYKIQTVCELGCGDGNNLKYYKGFNKYYGFDVSKTIIDINSKKFDNEKYSFNVLNTLDIPIVDLVMSLDVIYHLVEDDTFNNHMKQLFNSKSKYVIVYSSDFDSKRKFHMRHRKWTNNVSKNFSLIKKTNTPLNGSSANFYLYQNLNL
jgi:cyclopropane fatty-acyl-phospholipid synthase-like methyltransferase